MKKLLFLLLLIPVAQAADVNGYTAAYECKSGGANCNVDVATYTTAACAQTITTADSLSTIESKLNTGSSPICVTNGDYTGKGAISITASGTSGAYRVMRYYRSGDTDDEPWNQSSGNKASFVRLNFNGADYWIVHRIMVNGGGSSIGIRLYGTATHNIFSRIDAFDSGNTYGGIVQIEDGSDGTKIQNSYIHDCALTGGAESEGVLITGSTADVFLVNNEINNCTKVIYEDEQADATNFVIENNDIYIGTDKYTDCSGNYTPSGNCSITEYIVNFKDASDTISLPTRIIHNRIWGARPTDTNVSGDSANEGGLIALSVGGPGTSLPYSGADNVLIQNNLLFDAQQGIVTTGYNPAGGTQLNNHSVIGNIMYKFHTYASGYGTHALIWNYRTANELYLNTIIDSTRTTGSANHSWLVHDTSDVDSDIRCNVIIGSDTQNGTGSGTQIDYNVYYGTTDSGETHKLGNYTLNTRANSTAYSLGAIIRTTSTPPADGTAGDFLYIVTTAGTSAGSPPSYTTTLGGTTTDGTMVVKAVRGPKSFYRKLRTGAVIAYIPYATVHTSATEYQYCPSGFASRSGIGIDNTQP